MPVTLPGAGIPGVSRALDGSQLVTKRPWPAPVSHANLSPKRLTRPIRDCLQRSWWGGSYGLCVMGRKVAKTVHHIIFKVVKIFLPGSPALSGDAGAAPPEGETDYSVGTLAL